MELCQGIAVYDEKGVSNAVLGEGVSERILLFGHGLIPVSLVFSMTQFTPLPKRAYPSNPTSATGQKVIFSINILPTRLIQLELNVKKGGVNVMRPF